MSSGDETKKDSPSSEGSLPLMSKIKLVNDSQEDKESRSAPPHAKSKKGSDEDDAPPPKSNDSNSSSKTPPPKESPSKKSPPPPPPVASPPPPPVKPRVTTPPRTSVKKSPPSPPPPPSPSEPPTSSPPPSPSSSDGDNHSPGPPEQSAPSPDSQDSSSSNISSHKSPSPHQPFINVIFPALIPSVPPPQTQVEKGIESGSNHPSPLYSPGFDAGSNTRPSGSSNDSVPSTSEADGGGSGDGNTAKYVGIAFAGVCIVVFVALCFLVTKMRKRKRGAVHDVSNIPPNMKSGIVSGQLLHT